MRNLINLLIMAAIVVATCWGCSPKAITGQITDVNGEVVQCAGKSFRLLKNAPTPYKGQKATFTPVRSRKNNRINCKFIK